MSVTTHDISLETLDALQGYDALCLFVGEDERPLQGTAGYVDWRMCGGLSHVLKEGFFTGAEADSLLVPTLGRFPIPRIFVIGVGASKRVNPESLGRVLARAAEVLGKVKAESVALEIPGEGVVDEGTRAGAFKTQFLPAFKNRRVAVLGGKPLQRLLAD
ncbi:MAG: peptidase M17 [Myxococcaceae bacterium]|nr:peptidase M17 [Myxococcaceae bacterium]